LRSRQEEGFIYDQTQLYNDNIDPAGIISAYDQLGKIKKLSGMHLHTPESDAKHDVR
jgi:hypothetical protein